MNANIFYPCTHSQITRAHIKSRGESFTDIISSCTNRSGCFNNDELNIYYSHIHFSIHRSHKNNYYFWSMSIVAHRINSNQGTNEFFFNQVPCREQAWTLEQKRGRDSLLDYVIYVNIVLICCVLRMCKRYFGENGKLSRVKHDHSSPRWYIAICIRINAWLSNYAGCKPFKKLFHLF